MEKLLNIQCVNQLPNFKLQQKHNSPTSKCLHGMSFTATTAIIYKLTPALPKTVFQYFLSSSNSSWSCSVAGPFTLKEFWVSTAALEPNFFEVQLLKAKNNNDILDSATTASVLGQET